MFDRDRDGPDPSGAEAIRGAVGDRPCARLGPSEERLPAARYASSLAAITGRRTTWRAMRSTHPHLDDDLTFLRDAFAGASELPVIDDGLRAGLDRRLRASRGGGDHKATRSGSPRLLVGAGVLALVALIAGVVVVGTALREGATAWATPAPLHVRSSNSVPSLTELAQRVEARSAPTNRSIVDWSLWTTVDGDNTRSRIVPTATDQSRSADGLLETRRATGHSIPPDATIDEQTKQLEELLAADKANVVPATQQADIATLPRDTAALAAWAANRSGQPDEMAALTMFKDMLRQEPIPGDLIAAFYRLFSNQGRLRPLGITVDRLGRTGAAYQLDSNDSGLPTHHVLIIDPATGEPLANETVLYETAGELRVKIPAVIGYEIYLNQS
jgi:hypothetical protein